MPFNETFRFFFHDRLWSVMKKIKYTPTISAAGPQSLKEKIIAASSAADQKLAEFAAQQSKKKSFTMSQTKSAAEQVERRASTKSSSPSTRRPSGNSAGQTRSYSRVGEPERSGSKTRRTNSASRGSGSRTRSQPEDQSRGSRPIDIDSGRALSSDSMPDNLVLDTTL